MIVNVRLLICLVFYLCCRELKVVDEDSGGKEKEACKKGKTTQNIRHSAKDLIRHLIIADRTVFFTPLKGSFLW